MLLRGFFQPLLFCDPFCLPFAKKTHGPGIQEGEQSKREIVRNTGKKFAHETKLTKIFTTRKQHQEGQTVAVYLIAL